MASSSSQPMALPPTRRSVLAAALALVNPAFAAPAPPAAHFSPERRWYEAAAAMKRLGESWGDQPYGAVVVFNGEVVGNGPSRVVARGDASAHAEREAIRDARLRLGSNSLAGSVLYSTSRPCRQCESAAAEAHIARMIHGPALVDAGPPRP